MKRYPILNINSNIEIRCEDQEISEAIYKSLLPDNINFPENLNLEMKDTKKSILLSLKFKSNIEKGDNIETMSNTLEEIIEHVGIIKDVIRND
ncbi:MAG TPA: KEOPS complex subunit Pcc1 [Verrucomicrobiae bacterium]|nr:KEOPS complex subunit Pcc1 [Verrucomicrobiae bacterium]